MPDLRRRCLVPSIVLLLALAAPAVAHNGAVAFAGPVSSITVDGDLSDWPSDMPSYALTRAAAGVAPDDAADFSGAFRVGHDLAAGKLYVAIEVEDQSTVVEETFSIWNGSDGCEVYLDVSDPHGAFQDSNPVQWAIAGVSGRGYRDYSDLPPATGVLVRHGTRHVYEWELDLQGRQLKDVVGFDVVVLDRDDDGSFSWMAWGAQTVKSSSRSNVGDLQLVTDVDNARMDWDTFGAQALTLHVNRLRTALDYLGTPLPEETDALLDAAVRMTDGEAAVGLIKQALEPHTLMVVNVNPESRVKVQQGPAAPRLVQNDWQQFLVRVYNQAGVTAPLAVSAPDDDSHAWVDAQIHSQWPMQGGLSGLELDYRIIQIYSREAGKRAAVLSFDVGQGTQDLGFRSDVTLTFDVEPSHRVHLGVRDDNGEPTIAAFVIRNRAGRVFPSQASRWAPDFAFHPQVYRGDGESVFLPAGEYTFEVSRGPESIPQTRAVAVDGPRQESFDLDRWIDPAAHDWWSGDHHIHAAGCAHYADPARGVNPPDMIVHTVGEDLKIGATLTWGPGFDYQKQFFTGAEDTVSQPPYLIRYDVEVSGFGSHNSGHLCLLGLSEQIPPGGDSSDHWPTLCLNTLRWAKAQGAVSGPAHSGWGLRVATDDLPNYEVPGYDGIGANEFIVDVTHRIPDHRGQLVPAVDFLSMCDTPPVWELNIWYHTLNAGFRTRVSGETDFPCIYGERVGLGRAYVKIDDGISYAKWVEGIRLGRAYVSDGRSHLIDFQVGGVALGENGSELRLSGASTVTASARVAALLNEEMDRQMDRDLEHKPYWHVEKARIDSSRQVLVELVVNGYPVAERSITADGSLQDLAFDVDIEHSSWVAMRIFPSSHTNPVFVLVDDQPIRASKRSAQWCLDSVDRCWTQKERFIAQEEMADAVAAYEHARRTYRQILAESTVD